MNDVANLLRNQLPTIIEDTAWMRPEICMTALLIVNILTDLIVKKYRDWIFSGLALIGLLLTFALALQQWSMVQTHQEMPLLLDMLHLDRLSIYFKMLICLSAMVVVLTSWHYTTGADRFHLESLRNIGEYHSVLLALVLGAMLLTMSTHLLMIYLAIELVSLSSYILANFNFDRASAEASIKYILYGGVSSGLMLYGMSLMYGLTGNLAIYQSDFLEALASGPEVMTAVAGILVIGGFLFKVSSVPFHLWVPDVYEGAPTPVAALFSVVPKAAAFVVLLRVAEMFTFATHLAWQPVLAVIALLTILIGNLAALQQNNAKRMIAYSSIAHSGFILIGVLSQNVLGMVSVAFYVSVYALMNLAVFLIIKMISRRTKAEKIEQYKGLGLRFPFIGVLALIVLISLTGLPPTAGFTAKFFVFSSLWQAYQAHPDSLLLVVLIAGLFNTVLSLFYYLKIPYYMFFKKAETSSASAQFNDTGGLPVLPVIRQTKFNALDKILASVLIIPLLILFFKSNWLIELINTISFKF